MGRPKRGVTDEQRFWSHVTVGLSAATLGRAAIEGARHAEEDAAIERAASGPVAGLREAIDGLPLFKTRDGASWQFVSKKAVLHLLDAALLAEPVPPERFDRTWWHYADDCPVPPAEPVPHPWDTDLTEDETDRIAEALRECDFRNWSSYEVARDISGTVRAIAAARLTDPKAER